MPLVRWFEFKDLVILYKDLYSHIPLRMPQYLTFYSKNSRSRSTHLDSLSLVPNLNSERPNTQILNKSPFYRSHAI